jgi:23S rRNA maturation-related 3'-5' exoribonuclease YhaM
MEMLALVYDEQQLFCIPERDAVIHCMLSHHGRREWGSPVEPVTPEAYILHVADMLSSREGQ